MCIWARLVRLDEAKRKGIHLARGAPQKDYLPMLATWRELGGPDHCTFRVAVRATVTEEYARKHGVGHARNLRAAVRRLVPAELAPMTYRMNTRDMGSWYRARLVWPWRECSSQSTG